MTDKIDTSNEAVGRLVFASLTASPTDLSTMSTTLCALAVERDAERARAEKAERVLRRIEGHAQASVNAAQAIVNDCAALRQDEGG